MLAATALCVILFQRLGFGAILGFIVAVVQVAKRAGREVYFGDLYSPSTQAAAGLGKAAAVFVTSNDSQAAKALALTLQSLVFTWPSCTSRLRVLLPQRPAAPTRQRR